MSKLLLSCDEYIYEYSGSYYAPSQEWYDFYQRYLRVFDGLRLVTRCKREDELKSSRIPLAKDPRIEYVPLPFFQGPKEYAKLYFEYNKIIKEVVNGCDAAILRLPWTIAPRIHKKIKSLGIPYACEVVFDAEDAWKSTHGIERFLWKKVDKDMRKICAGADGVSCVTEHYLQKHYYSLKKSAFTSSYSSLALPSTFYESPKKFINKTQFIIAHVANQVEYQGRKGHNETIRALSFLKSHGFNVSARFAGKDYNGGVKQLQKMADDLGVLDRVDFVGYLSREDLSHFLSSADLYIMPTRAEGLPRVIIEAMAKGLPCITTPVSGNTELIEEKFLVSYEDVIQLAEKIKELLTNKQLYEETSRKNFERSRRYEAYLLQDKRDAFYEELKRRINPLIGK